MRLNPDKIFSPPLVPREKLKAGNWVWHPSFNKYGYDLGVEINSLVKGKLSCSTKNGDKWVPHKFPPKVYAWQTKKEWKCYSKLLRLHGKLKNKKHIIFVQERKALNLCHFTGMYLYGFGKSQENLTVLEHAFSKAFMDKSSVFTVPIDHFQTPIRKFAKEKTVSNKSKLTMNRNRNKK